MLFRSAVILDATVCDAAALADGLRERGFSGTIIVIDADAADADAAFARPIRFADLVATLNAPSRRPRADAGLRLTEKEAAILERLEQARQEALGDAWLASWDQGLPAWQDTPGQINLPTLLWLHNLIEAWDLKAYARARYGLLGSGGHWFPGANADRLDAEVSEAELLACLAGSPWAARIPDLLRELRRQVGGQATRRLMADP